MQPSAWLSSYSLSVGICNYLPKGREKNGSIQIRRASYVIRSGSHFYIVGYSMRLQEFSEPLTFINFLRGIITTRFVSAKVHRFHKVVRKPYVTPTIFCTSFIDNREFVSHFHYKGTYFRFIACYSIYTVDRKSVV